MPSRAQKRKERDNDTERTLTVPVTAGPATDRQRLPAVWRHVVWHPESGVVVCPLHRELPTHTCGPDSTKPEDLVKTRLLTDQNIYLAFYPRKPITRGKLFSVLAASDEQLANSISIYPGNPPRYILGSSIREAWTNLENSLVEVSSRLLAHHPAANRHPIIEYPQYPTRHGYNVPHSTQNRVISCAKRARTAFAMLSALTTFALSLWLSEFEEDCFDAAFETLAVSGSDPLPRSWLDYLRDSVVCDLTPGLRPGAFIDPYSTHWGQWVKRFTRAGVPIWFLWGKENTYKKLPPVDTEMVFYLPPDRYIEHAKDRFAVFAATPIPTPETYYLRLAPGSAIPPSGPPINFPDAPASSIVGSTPLTSGPSTGRAVHATAVPSVDDSYYAFAPDVQNPDDPPPPPPPIDRTQIVNKGARQRPGESWEEFCGRMEESLEARVKNENPKEKQQRESRQAHAEKSGYSNSSTVFIWEQDQEIPTFYRRTVVLKSEAENEWCEVTKYQRRYWAHLNEWDLCPQLPSYPPGVNVPIDTYDDDDETWVMHDGENQGGGGLVGETMKRTVKEVARQEIDARDALYRMQFPSLEEYLKLRHGFHVEPEGSWNPSLHIEDPKLTLRPDAEGSLRLAITRLLYGPQALVVATELSRSIVNFQNIAVAPSETLTHEKLPRSWDISRISKYPPLFLDPRRLTLQAVSNKLDGLSDLYVLRPPPNSKDSSRWFIATTSASTVLLVYRSPWTTMSEICRGLLDIGAPFRTVVERRRGSTSQSQCVLSKSVGLGRRPRGFKPKEEDYHAYEAARDIVLRSACGRAIRLRGGIAGRIASEVVPDIAVLDGPVVGDEIVGFHDDVEFVDDHVDEEELDKVCGVYHVLETAGGAMVSHSSWWPKQNVWLDSGLLGDQWSPAAESFYVQLRDKLRDGKFQLQTSTSWRGKIKHYFVPTGRIVRFGNRMAAGFLAESFRAR